MNGSNAETNGHGEFANGHGNVANGHDNVANGHGNVANGNGNHVAAASNGRGNGVADPNGNAPRADPNGNSADELRTGLDELARAKEQFGTAKVPNIKLHCGDEMPAIALGTAMLCEGSETVAIIKAAIDLGYRHIDTAPIYGTEMQVGEAIRAKIKDGTVTREELFVTTKLWSTYHRRDLVEGACRDSLQSLGLEYLDLFLIHNPISLKEDAGLFPRRDGAAEASKSSDYMDAWYGMEDLVREGLVRNIGVSNFNSEQVARVVNEGAIVPAVNQVECHQYLNQGALSEFCKARGVLLVGYGTLGSAGTPPQYLTAGRPVLQEPLAKCIAEKYGMTPAQVLIRLLEVVKTGVYKFSPSPRSSLVSVSYQLQRGHGVVVRSSTAPRLWGNLQAATFTLTEDEMRALSELDAGERHYKMADMGENNKNYPFKIPF